MSSIRSTRPADDGRPASEGRHSPDQRQTPAQWAVGLVFIVVTLLICGLAAVDLRVYRAGAAQFLRDPSKLYAPGLIVEGAPSLPFTYPPFAALVMTPMAVIPVLVAVVVTTLLSLGLLYLVMRDLGPRLARLLPERLHWSTAPIVLTGLACLTGPYRDSIGFGQINIILFSAIYLACVRWGLGFLAGLVIGLFGGIKLTPVALGLVPLAQRKWGMIAGMAVGFFGSVALMFAVNQALSRQYWFDVLRDPSRIGGIGYFDNISLEGVLARINADSKPLWLGLSLVVIALTLWVLVRLRGVLDIPSQLGVGAICMLLISPISWSHHAAWLPVMIYAVLFVGARVTRGRALFAGGALWLFLLMGVGVRAYGKLLGNPDTMESGAWMAFACLPAVTLVALLALLLWARIPRTHPAS
jgi:alpha-1,2-mannosyltransferase